MSKIKEEKKELSEEQNEQQKETKTEKKTEKTDKKASEQDKKVSELEEKVKSLEDSLKKEKDDYLRLMAEFENFRRRTSEEKLDLVKTASSDTIKGMLPVLDDLDRAMELLKDSNDESAKEGTTLIYNKLFAYLKSKGLEKIEAKGQDFDTDFHEAVTQFPAPSEDMKGKVVDVIQAGYTLGGKVLRYAKVVVGS